MEEGNFKNWCHQAVDFILGNDTIFSFPLPSCVQFFHKQHLEILNLNSWYAILFVICQRLIISQMNCYFLISSVEECDTSWNQGVSKCMYYLFWNLNEKRIVYWSFILDLSVHGKIAPKDFTLRTIFMVRTAILNEAF